MRFKITSAEQDIIVERAKKKLLENPSLSITKLWNISCQGICEPNKQVPWFSKRIKKLKIFLIKEQVPKEPLVESKSVESKLIPKESNFIDALIQEKKIFDEQMKSLKVSMEHVQNRIDSIETKINSFKGLLENILGDLSSYVPRNVSETKETIKKHLPKIAIIGPLKDQFNQIYQKIENKAILYWLEKDNPIHENQLKNYDYIVISRHCRHAVTWTAESAIGKENVFRIAGGIVTISNKIKEIINHGCTIDKNS